MSVKSKACNKCLVEKTIDNFPVQKRRTPTGTKEYRRAECRPCYNEYYNKYLSNSPAHKDRVKRGKRKRRVFVDSLKTECSICGYSKCKRALHFHHLIPSEKEFAISWSHIEQLSEEKIMKEVEKCVLLCANCHAEVESGILILPQG